MTQPNSLNGIIRQVTEHAKHLSGKEEIIIIDSRTGQAVTNPGIFETLVVDFRYFLVANRNAEKLIGGTKQVKYKQGSGEVVFAIGYQGGCLPGQEWKVAQCFFRAPFTDDSMRDALARWLIEYFSSAGRTIDDFPAEKTGAARELANRAEIEFGLDLKLTLEVEGLKALETIEIGPLLISSRLKGSDEEESIWLKIELAVDQQLVLRALLHQKQPLTETLKRGLRTYLANNVTLLALYDDRDSDQIKQGLQAHLDTRLRPFGRRVGFLSLKLSGGPPPPFNGETSIDYRHHDYPDLIRIKVSALLLPKNPSRYKAKGSPKLKEWLDDNLREVIELVLFGVPYIDLLLEFEELKERIGERMNLRAEQIGYQIEQLMTILYLEPFQWLKRVDIQVKGDPNADSQSGEAWFATKLSNFYVGLEIFLTARIKDLRGIEKYLTTKQDVPQRMKEEILRLTRRALHGTDPERVYMRFSERDPENFPNEEPLEEELRKEIRSRIEAEFNAEVIDLVLKPMDSDLTRKLADISKRANDFFTPAELGMLPGAPTIMVKGNFKVDGVEGWQAFKECEVTVEAVRKRIEDSIRARLKSITVVDESIFVDQNELVDVIKQTARDLVKDEFGLAIRLKTVYWDWDDRLKKLGEQQSREDLLAVQERVSRLKERLLDLYENDANPDEIAEVRESIRRLSGILPPALASSVGMRQLAEPRVVKSLPAAEIEEH